MTYEVFYRVGEFDDSIIIEGDSIGEIRENIDKEIVRRNAEYRYSNWLND